jgi:uncharacterized membrane protein
LNNSVSQLFTNFLPTDFNPPGYYLVLKAVVAVFGSSEIGLRSISVAAGVGTIYLIFKLGKLLNLQNPKLAAWLAATSPLLIHYSQEARAYSLAVFLVCLMYYFYLKFSGVKKYWIPGLVFTAAVFTHYLTVFSAIPILLLVTSQNQRIKKTLYFLLPLLLVFSFWLPVFKQQLGFGTSAVADYQAWGSVLGRPTLKNLLLVPVKFLLGRTTFTNQNVYYLNALLAVLIYLFLTYSALQTFVKKNRMLLFFWLAGPLLAGFVVSFFTPLFTYFRFLYVLPVVYLLAARGAEIFQGRAKVLVPRFLIFLNLFYLIIYWGNPQNLRENWQGAAEFLKQAEGQVLVYQQFEEPLQYYEVEAENDPEEVESSQLWFVTYGENIVDPEHRRKKQLEQKGFKYDHVTTYNGVTVEKWERN